MKKKNYLLAPAVVFAAVFAAGMLLHRYTFIQKEFFGLFLNTPDYFAEVKASSRPLLTLAGDFVTQFYRIPWAGPALTALLVSLVFLAARKLLRLFTRGRAAENALAVLAVASVIVIYLLPANRDRERWAKVEYACLKMQWEKVVNTISPEAAGKDRVLIPYALLAWSELGRLPENLFRYPVAGPADIDLEGELTRHGYYFASIMNECMGCTNEAIHNTFQTACTTPHGMSLGILRQLIKYNISSGDKTIALKYCDILETNPVSARTARAARRHIGNMQDGSRLDKGGADTAAVVTHSTYHNLRLMAQSGYFNSAAADRFRCILLLQRDLRNFAASFSPETDIAALPLIYQQALCLVPDPEIQKKISPSVMEAFGSYMQAYNQLRTKDDGPIQAGTFWEYYLNE